MVGLCSWETHSSQATWQLGVTIASLLQPGDILGLYGDLASGKTTFAQGICHQLHVKVPVTSPTFTLINEYPGDIPVYHFDCYRFHSAEELVNLGYEEYFYGEGLVLIEWADRIEKYLPEETIKLRFEHVFGDTPRRKIELLHPENREELCVSLQ